ncbi:hypothetical protein SAMN04488040_0237 [Sulfitobacter marinus]|jgi:hypothetical protein|uniref:Uncharacterized protein n=1 Tax=Sulfitobacter marinus TaxID=394264 RepID=A0A1I6PM00_9RHOB|nr:hypothetical protein [Sulfitobacter marinus]SFS41222.1 hypothetical protein SAMN04488040_0237 [Sulfitobacter marinus]
MLYNRIIKQGTINEPEGKPDPQFALPATVNWMRALRILAEDEGIDFTAAISYYRQEGKRNMDARVENTVLEQLFLGLHHLSALDQFRGGTTAADYARVGVLAWYYGIANAASAMTAAQSGSFQEDHAGTARLWDEQIASRSLAMAPFSWRVSSLVGKTYKTEIDALRNASSGKLQTQPITKDDAQGAAAGYLSGSAKWYAWKTEEDLRRNRAFRDLGVDNFRSKPARALRDQWLDRKPVGFVHQAARYRGKANYREALFLAYGPGTETLLSGYIDDMHAVLKAFLVMAGAFASRKLGKNLWLEFVADVDAKKAFTTSASNIWT